MSIVKLNKLQHMPENMSHFLSKDNQESLISNIKGMEIKKANFWGMESRPKNLSIINYYIFQFGMPIESKD